MRSTRQRRPAATAAIGTQVRTRFRSPKHDQAPVVEPPAPPQPSDRTADAVRRHVHSNAQAARDRKSPLRRPALDLVFEDRRLRHHQPQVRQPDRPANGRHGRCRLSKKRFAKWMSWPSSKTANSSSCFPAARNPKPASSQNACTRPPQIACCPLVDRELQIRLRHGIAELQAERSRARTHRPRTAKR